jgi:hypothetical protein
MGRRDDVIANFQSDKVQKHRHSRYEKVDPDQLVDLLNEVSGRWKTEATHLLQRLATRRWHIHSTAHEGGSDPNAPLHILLIAPKGIHLNCKTDVHGNLYVYEITYE